jgi:hypothetical protein
MGRRNLSVGDRSSLTDIEASEFDPAGIAQIGCRAVEIISRLILTARRHTSQPPAESFKRCRSVQVANGVHVPRFQRGKKRFGRVNSGKDHGMCDSRFSFATQHSTF